MARNPNVPASRLAVVTGANRGIGLEICRQLGKRDGIRVVLTARNESQGRAAAETLRAEGADVDFHELDVTQEESVRALSGWLQATYGRCDILINNAGVLADPRGSRVLDAKSGIWRQTLDTNVLGPMLLIRMLAPLMKKNGYGRIVNMSSELGQLAEMGAGTPAYRVSKAALNALTRTLAAELGGTGILVNTMSPGWVKTDMGGSGAPRTVEQGADTALWLATLPDDGPNGGFFRDRKPIPW